MTCHFTVQRGRRAGKRQQLAMAICTDEVIPGVEKSRAASKTLEKDVQAAVLAILQKHPRVAWCARINTAGGFLVSVKDWKALLTGKPATRWMARFIRFAFPGCSDILGQLKDGRFLAVECKSSVGEASDEQLAFLSTVNRHNGVGFIARRPESVFDHLPLEG